MIPTIESLGLTALPFDQKLGIAHDLWDHLFQVAKPTLSEAQRAEIDRRLADIAANPDDDVPWEDVREMARKRFGV